MYWCVLVRKQNIFTKKLKKIWKDVYYFESNQEVIARLDELLKEDDVILVKGSHSMNLKEVVEKI